MYGLTPEDLELQAPRPGVHRRADPATRSRPRSTTASSPRSVAAGAPRAGDRARPVRDQHPDRARRPRLHARCSRCSCRSRAAGSPTRSPGACAPRPSLVARGRQRPPARDLAAADRRAARREECYAITEEFAGSDVSDLDGDRAPRRRRLRPRRREVARHVVQRGRLRVLPGRADHRCRTPASRRCSSSTRTPPAVRVVRTPTYTHTIAHHHPIVAFEDVRVPATHLVGDEGDGMSFVYEWFRFERLMVAARCLGAAERLVDETTAFAQERGGRRTAAHRASSSSRRCSPTA